MLNRDLKPFIMLDEWQASFLRREINNMFDSYFAGNGYYPNDNKYDTDIRLNLQVFCDENQRVKSMSYYKVHDLTMGHGKPVLRDVSLSKRDISVFTKALSECTISTADNELGALLNKASKGKLLGGWKISGFDKRVVSFSDRSGKEIKIPRSRICKAIDISHNYLEVLTYKEFWLANQDCLRLEDADPLLALFALVDPSQYYEYDQLLSETEKRVQQSESTARLKLLAEAVKEGNTREVNKQLKHILMYQVAGKDLSDALCIAIQQRNESLARLLVKNGADISVNTMVNGHMEGPLFYAIDNDWDSFVLFCVKQQFQPDRFGNDHLVDRALEKGKPDLAIKLLKAGCWFLAFFNVLSSWSPADLHKALNIPDARIKWDIDALQELKDAGENKLLMKALAHLSYTPEYFRGDIVRWLFNTGDFELMKYYMKQGYPPLTKKSQFRLYNFINPNSYTEQWVQFYCDELFGDVWVWKEFISSSIKLGNNDVWQFLLEHMRDRLDEKQVAEINRALQNRGGVKQ